QLRLERVADGRLEPIRFQLDARDADGEIVLGGPDEFEVDDNDELVFMAADAGGRADPSLLPEDCAGALEIELRDPTKEDARAFAYLLAFADAPPLPRVEPYVRFDLEKGEARSDAYRVSYAAERNFFTGIEIPRRHGGNDANLLRQTRM